MSYRPLPSHSQVRPSSGLANSRASHAHSQSQSSQLNDRIQEKRAELENLRQLRDLSAGLAGQMQQLEEKLGTLSNGTEAVAAVLSNWHNVLRAISMASQKIPVPKSEGDGEGEGVEEERQLPQTLVRIPVQQAEDVRREAEAKEGAGD
ncbi:hypothetical protein MBLNU230_g6309t1 [Neophaeotheca triangularis]